MASRLGKRLSKPFCRLLDLLDASEHRAHESQLVEGILGHSFLDTLPARLIGDKAYDSDRLDRTLAARYGIEMIASRRTPEPDAGRSPFASVP
jgi:hypothetical protein